MPYKTLPTRKLVRLIWYVVQTPATPKKHEMNSALLLPIAISLPPETAPMVIPSTTEVPIKAYL